MIKPITLGAEISDMLKSFEKTMIETVVIPEELMPTGEASSAHASQLLFEAMRLQLYGPDIPSERERIEKRYAEIKQEVKCELIGKLSSVLKAKIDKEK